LFARALAGRRVRARYVDARTLIATDGRFGGASPDLAATDRRVRAALRPLMSRGGVPVVPGFLGEGPDGRVATLGRGGSDLTATLLGRALGARAVWLWKDVPGMLTADPRVVPEARVIPQLNLREASELAYYGARVLHPRALIPVIGRRVPVVVRPFADPQAAGTEISGRRTLGRYPVKAVSAMAGQALVTVSGNGMLGVPGVAARTFEALHREGISVSLISQASSEHSICLTVPAAAAARARRSLLAAFAAERARREIDDVDVRTGLATVAVVGLGMAGTPGIAARVFSAVAAGGINVVAVAQGSSELNISFVVEEGTEGAALRRIHDDFQLAKIGGGAMAASRSVDVALLGFGGVGRTLARLLRRPAPDGRPRLRLVAIIDRGGFAFRQQGLSARALDAALSLKSAGRSVAGAPGGIRSTPGEALAYVARHALSRPVLVDVTAEETGPLLAQAAAAGMDLVLANKRPLAGRRDDAQALREAARRNGVRLRYEATVGAGLPILDTFRKLVESGDRVLRVEGALSGTLGHLLHETGRGTPFSAALREARDRGYTEPDPRDDLSGADVGRKALILARLLGYAGEPESVRVESLVTARGKTLPVQKYLARLADLDPEWEARQARARARGRVLRYLARISRRSVRVGLVEVDRASPFASLRGTDNQVVFTTVRYRSRPLVITGPGAGQAVTAAGILNDILELGSA
jgi:aspartokinase/homoserine dehydrogenase 1